MVNEAGAVALGGGAALAEALERVMRTAEAGIAAQRRIALEARRVAQECRLPDGAAPWPRVRSVLDRLSASGERLSRAAGDLRRTWAAALAVEGMTGRQIARQLGVSHQRVSVLLARPGDLPHANGSCAARPDEVGGSALSAPGP